MEDYTDTQIGIALKEISEMSHLRMCKLWRFAPKGSEIYFRADLATGLAFKKRLFDHFGGYTPEISKKLGWDG